VILTGRAEYAAGQLAPSPNVFQNLTLRVQYLAMWKLNDAHFIDQPISYITCTFDYFFSDMFCQESEGSAYSYPFSVLCVVVFKGWTRTFCPTDRSQVFDVNKDLLESVLLNDSLGFSSRHNMPVLNNLFGMKRGASDDNGRASCKKRALFAVVALLDSGTVRSLPRGQLAWCSPCRYRTSQVNSCRTWCASATSVLKGSTSRSMFPLPLWRCRGPRC